MNVILLPGTLCDETLFAPQIAAFEKYRAAIHVADLTQDDTIQAMADRVLARAPATFTLVALSMGGIVAFEIIRRVPERVAGMILYNTTHKPITAEGIAINQQRIELVEAGKFNQLIDELLYGGLIRPAALNDAVLVAKVRGMMQDVGGEAYIRQAHALNTRPDNTAAIQAYDDCVTIVGGDQDQWCDVAIQYELHTMLPNSYLEIIKDCGHLSTLEQPNATVGSVRAWSNARMWDQLAQGKGTDS